MLFVPPTFSGGAYLCNINEMTGGLGVRTEDIQFAATAMRGRINMQATLVAMKGITGNTIILLTLTAVLTALPAYHHKRKRET